MTTVTLDTSVLASGFVNHPDESPPAAILLAWRTRLITLALSEHILTELTRTFQRPYFQQQLGADTVAANITLLRQRARIVPLTAAVHGVTTHPEDDLILSTALSGKAEYLVTGDGPFLRRVPSYQGVQLISPRDFLTVLEGLSTP